jgi:SAM-dependent methyltransferase
MTDDDVPSKIDLRDPVDAAAWVAAADVTRPWRRELRAAIVGCVQEAARARVLDAARVGLFEATRIRVLELGPGPGLLAEAILDACDVESYTLFDFSQPMLDTSKQRLGDRVRYVLGDYTRDGWTSLVDGPFDVIVSMQAVHEVRHKRHVPRLYAAVLELLRPGGVVVVCDHEPTNDLPLHSTVQEHHAAFAAAGFSGVETVMTI